MLKRFHELLGVDDASLCQLTQYLKKQPLFKSAVQRGLKTKPSPEFFGEMAGENVAISGENFHIKCKDAEFNVCPAGFQSCLTISVFPHSSPFPMFWTVNVYPVQLYVGNMCFVLFSFYR